MKIWRLLILFIFMFLFSNNIVQAGPNEEIMKQQLDVIDVSPIDSYWQKLNQEYKEYLPNTKTPSLVEMIFSKDSGGFSLANVLNGFLKFILHEIIENGKLLGTIILLTVFAAILENLQNSFQNSSISKIAMSITFMVLIILAINSFYLASHYVKIAIQGMTDFMLAIVPILLALLTSMGNVTSATLFHPLIIFMVNMSGTLIFYVIFPLLFFSTMLDLISLLNERYKLTQLAKLMRQIGVGMLGIFLTIFLGVLSVQGAVSSVSDGLAIRTAKYVTGNFVPVVGKMFSDAAETVVGASLLLKNGIGIVGAIILLFVAVFPALKIIVLSFVYKVSSAVLQPLGNGAIISTLNTIGNSLLYLFAALATLGLMFFLALTIIVTAANLSIMIR